MIMIIRPSEHVVLLCPDSSWIHSTGIRYTVTANGFG